MKKAKDITVGETVFDRGQRFVVKDTRRKITMKPMKKLSGANAVKMAVIQREFLERVHAAQPIPQKQSAR